MSLSLIICFAFFASLSHGIPADNNEFNLIGEKDYEQHVQHFKDIAQNMELPGDTSPVIVDFLRKSLTDLENIAENYSPNIFNRTFSGNAIVVNGSTLHRTSEFYSFLDRIKKSKTSNTPILISDNWSELKNFINNGNSKDTIIESFEYIIQCQYTRPGQIFANAFWIKVKQIANQTPQILRKWKNFVIDYSSNYITGYDQQASRISEQSPILNIEPIDFNNGVLATNPKGYTESYSVQSSADKTPIIYVTQVFLNPLNSTSSLGEISKEAIETAKLKAEYFSLRERLDNIIKTLNRV